jgi:hypothetical protein
VGLLGAQHTRGLRTAALFHFARKRASRRREMGRFPIFARRIIIVNY